MTGFILAGFGLAIFAALLLVYFVGYAIARTLRRVANEAAGTNVCLRYLVWVLGNNFKLSPKKITALQEYAAQEFSDPVSDPAESYSLGLKDGQTMTAQFVLSEVKEENNA